MSTIRQQIVDAVEARFKGIKKVSGYDTDIGNRVFVCRMTRPLDSEMPVLNIWDLQQTTTQITSQTQEHKLGIVVWVSLKGSDAGAQVRQMLGDLSKAVGTDITWGGLALYSLPVKDAYELDQHNELTGNLNFEFSVIYRTKNWDLKTKI